MSNNLLKAAACTLLLLASACEKTVPELPEKPQPTDLQTVTFNLKGFTSAINPLNVMEGRQNMSSNLPKASGLAPNEQEQFLYFWSFNEENTVADIALHTTEAQISFTAADTNPGFITGYGLSPYPAGKALNIKGLKELLIHVSLKGASEVKQLAFDVGSSGTGPKNFNLQYSIDNGLSYQPLSVDNPFENTKDNTRNSYTFDLSTLVNSSEQLTLKLEPFAGERGEAKEYNPNTGTFKIDNLRVSGIFNQDQPEEPGDGKGTIHYHIFNAGDHSLATEGIVPFNDGQSPAITVKLPVGLYYASFVSNSSDTALLLPPTVIDAASWWISNRFSNYQAVVFGTTVPDLSVDKNTEIEATLNRYFSEIKFEFTDEDDLSDISKIIVKQLQDALVYAPYRNPSTYAMEDSTVITLNQPFTQTHKSIQFNQFIGQVNEAVDLAYRVEVYDRDDELIRSFDVSSAIKNNVQLLFKGNLLSGTDKQGHFQIEWNKQWNDALTEDF